MAGILLVASLVASWPVIVNGGPFLLSDTMTYVRSGDAAVFRITGKSSDWTKTYEERFETVQANGDKKAADAARHPVIIAGRSIYYGVFLYAAYQLGGLPIAALIQAMLAMVCLYLTVARFVPRGRSRDIQFLALTVFLCVASSLAFFTSYLVPDLFAGLGILAAAHLLTSKDGSSHWSSWFWTFILALSAAVHTSDVLIVGVILLAAMLRNLLVAAPKRSSISLVAVALLIGLASEALNYAAVEAAFGDPPVRPPFGTARLVADGPGMLYLKETCPGSGLQLCRYTQRMARYNGYGWSDTFLWSADPHYGVFSAVAPDERRRLASENTRFVIAVFASHPLLALQSTLRSVVEQSSKWGLSEFNLTSAQRAEFASGLPPSVMRVQDQTLAFQQEMPVTLVERLTLPFAFLSLAAVAWALWRRKGDDSTRSFVIVLLLGVVLDVVVCGALSTPHDRYLMRVAWLLPFAAFLCFAPRNRDTDVQNEFAAKSA